MNLGHSSLRMIVKTIGEHEKSVPQEGMLDSYTEVDLNYTHEFKSNTSLTLGVTNLLASTPPLDETNQNQQLNANLYNPRGQSVFIGLKQRF